MRHPGVIRGPDGLTALECPTVGVQQEASVTSRRKHSDSMAAAVRRMRHLLPRRALTRRSRLRITIGDASQGASRDGRRRGVPYDRGAHRRRTAGMPRSIGGGATRSFQQA